MIELCQLNRKGNDNTPPTLKALHDRVEIEQEADGVLFLWTAEKNTTGRFQPMAFYLAKNRHRAADEVAVNWDEASKKLEVVKS